MKVLVTGANGFVGRPLCSDLKRRGHWVVAGVRSEDRGAGLDAHDVVVLGDLANWEDPLNGAGSPDAVVHLAARVHDRGNPSAADFHAENVVATQTLARSAVRHGVGRLLFVSSVKAVGETSGTDPWNEKTPPAPADPYGRSKWDAERALGLVAAQTGLEVICLRPPLVYGPGVEANFRRLLGAVSRGLPVLGSPKARRSFVYVGNLVDAIAKGLEVESAGGETFFVSDGAPLSVPELAALLAKAAGRPARVISLGGSVARGLSALPKVGGMVDRLTSSLVVSDAKIRARLGWSPPYSPEEGITETVKWYKTF